MTQAQLTAHVDLTAPIKAAVDGKDNTWTTLQVNRPRTRHAKRLVLLLGREFIQKLMSEISGEDGKDGAKDSDLIAEAVALLVDETRLDGLTALIADLCGVPQDAIDDTDIGDLMVLAGKLIGFFSELPSIASLNS